MGHSQLVGLLIANQPSTEAGGNRTYIRDGFGQDLTPFVSTVFAIAIPPRRHYIAGQLLSNVGTTFLENTGKVSIMASVRLVTLYSYILERRPPCHKL